MKNKILGGISAIILATNVIANETNQKNDCSAYIQSSVDVRLSLDQALRLGQLKENGNVREDKYEFVWNIENEAEFQCYKEAYEKQFDHWRLVNEVDDGVTNYYIINTKIHQ